MALLYYKNENKLSSRKRNKLHGMAKDKEESIDR
jgi:hypothetical protein